MQGTDLQMIKLLLSRPAYVKATKAPDFSRNIDQGDATFLGIKVRFAEVIARSLVPRPIDRPASGAASQNGSDIFTCKCKRVIRIWVLM